MTALATGAASAGAQATPPAELAAAAAQLLGPGLAAAGGYARWLGTAGLERGLLGPREGDRLWDRHLLNCAALAELVPPGAHVVDVGSGAGLPGVVLALARPDLRVTLVDSLLRRTLFLTETVDRLGLADRVQVHRARAEELRPSPAFDAAVARAVASLPRLGSWVAPLVRPGGLLLAIRGEAAPAEVAAGAVALARSGWMGVRVRRCGVGVLPVPTTVVSAVRQ